jgi:hypothetical protein
MCNTMWSTMSNRIALAFLLVLGLAACGGKAHPDTSPGREGEVCGGAATPPDVPRRCAAGLVCRNEANDVGFPGTCMKQTAR